MIDSYNVTLEDAFWTLDELIAICERVYKVSYAHWQYCLDPSPSQKGCNMLYCGSDYMGRVREVRASKESGYDSVYFECVPAMVKL